MLVFIGFMLTSYMFFIVLFSWIEEFKINVATTSKDIKVLKCRHGKRVYKYLCQLSSTLWAVLVYEEDDETLEWDNVFFSYADALYAYNHYEE